MKHSRHLIALTAAASFAISCISPHITIERSIEPAVRYETGGLGDRTAVAYTAWGEVSLRHVSPDDWESISDSAALIDADDRFTSLPDCLLFAVCIKNRSDKALTGISFSLRHGAAGFVEALSGEELSKRFLSPKKIQSGSKLTAFRIIKSKNPFIADFDYDRDSITTPYKILLPGDTIITFAAFPIPEPEVRTFSLSLTLDEGGAKKIVAIEMTRNEHRQDFPAGNTKRK